MTPNPTGRLRGTDLVLTRRFRAPIEDVWTSVTDPASTARWFGTWKGPSGPGSAIKFQMAFEKGEPWIDATIEACEPPRRYVVVSMYGTERMRLEVTLTQTGDTTELELTHHAVDPKGVADFGPGWEYYLDNLVAAREGRQLPTFETYYPAQKPYYAGLATAT